jgi:hypothetical protein
VQKATFVAGPAVEVDIAFDAVALPVTNSIDGAVMPLREWRMDRGPAETEFFGALIAFIGGVVTLICNRLDATVAVALKLSAVTLDLSRRDRSSRRFVLDSARTRFARKLHALITLAALLIGLAFVAQPCTALADSASGPVNHRQMEHLTREADVLRARVAVVGTG